MPTDSHASSNLSKSHQNALLYPAVCQKTAWCSYIRRPLPDSKSCFDCHSYKTDILLYFLSLLVPLSACGYMFSSIPLHICSTKRPCTAQSDFTVLPFPILCNRQKAKVPFCSADIRVVHCIIVLDEIMPLGYFNHFSTL